MAFLLPKPNTLQRFGGLFRIVVNKEIVKKNLFKSQTCKPLFLNCQQCQAIHTQQPLRVVNLQKIYKLVRDGKDRGVPVWVGMTVKELSESLKRPPGAVLEMIEKVNNGRPLNKSSTIDSVEILKGTCKLFRVKPSLINKKKTVAKPEVDKDIYPRPLPSASEMVRRPPVVTVMGHVDHGKTTLLDTLRNANVVKSEFGGITQHIGAFTVKVKDDTITFMDTPGHAAFTAMRARGAQATDIVVLVVAADDGVMEQTVESIRMAKAAKVPIIVAVNKIDKHQADIDNTLHELVNYEVVAESLGGDVQAVPVSALTGQNLEALAEAILAEAEILDLRADPKGLVEGVVIESRKDPYRGVLSTALVQRGTLRKGDVLVAGTAFCKVRVMMNHEGKTVEKASPSTPVEVVGWREPPTPGDIILQVQTEKLGNEVVAYRKQKYMLEKQRIDSEEINKRTTEEKKKYTEERLERLSIGKLKARRERISTSSTVNEHMLSLIIKGDVNGSIEAILDVLNTYDQNDLCQLDLVAAAVGEPTDTDIELAELFNAVIYCFNVKVPDKIALAVEEKNIKLKSHNVIYHLINDIKEEISLKMPPTFRDEILGEAKILDIFEVSHKNKKWKVAGCECTSGNIRTSKNIRILRDEEVLFDGKIRSLRHLKEEVPSVKSGVQCGIMPDSRDVTFEVGDKIISYETVEDTSKTPWNPGF